MFFFLFIDICVVSREVNVYDFLGRTINNWDKVLQGKTTMNVGFLRSGLPLTRG